MATEFSNQHTVDRETFTLKTKKISCSVKVSRFRSTREYFLMVEGYNMDGRLESSWRLVYYQVSGEPGIAGCSRRLDIYLRARLFIDDHSVA